MFVSDNSRRVTPAFLKCKSSCGEHGKRRVKGMEGYYYMLCIAPASFLSYVLQWKFDSVASTRDTVLALLV